MANKLSRMPRVGQTPRANFLPPRIKALHEARQARHRLALVSLLVLVACGLGYAGVQSLKFTSEANLFTARDETTEILTEQAQYSDIVLLIDESRLLNSAVTVAKAAHVDWSHLIGHIHDAVPDGGRILSLNLSAPSSTESPTVVEPLTGKPIIVTAKVSMFTPTFAGMEYFLLDARQWPGYSNALVTELNQKSNGFEATLTISLGVEALSQASQVNGG
ncbi:hypothetical protein [Rhodoluna limnophila]|uniref:hypothetical protein n=1 Tax=Rhodoluna limnophila TaxID=232537 RepID=UPI0011066C8E|nr:hypothetical protein [Rhodoluna limnophila]